LSSFQDIWGNGDASALNGFLFRFDDGNKLDLYDISGSVQWRKVTTQVFRDASAWYHFVISYNTANATAADRVRIYVNGVRIDSFSSSSDPSLNYDGYINNTNAHSIGRTGAYNGLYLNGYLADIHFIDGQALDPTSFGEFDDNGIWQPIAYSGSYGTNGFHLDFADNSSAAALGYDAAGLNDWTVNNLSVTAGAGNDSLVDVPTNGSEVDAGTGGSVRGNYCTLNPLFSSATLTNGNLDAEGPSSAWHIGRGTIAFPTSGKWYWEATITGSSGGSVAMSVATASAANSLPDFTTGTGYYGIVNNTGTTTNKVSNGSATVISTAAAWAQNDILMCAYDGATGKVWFGRNGTWYPPTSGGSAGDPAAGTNETLTASGTVFPAVHSYGSSGDVTVNFGQRPFAYTAPSGFKALCTANLPAPVVTKPSDVMDVALYTGTGSANTRTVSFSPDFVWVKPRSNANPHQLFDTVRGDNARLKSNATDAEYTYPSGAGLTFGSTGFTVGTDNGLNQSGESFVAWTWDAGSSTVTNTQGSITSQVRANASAGFSIITATQPVTANLGCTVGHGLGVAPSMYIVKDRDLSINWGVYHSGLSSPATQALQLSTTSAAFTATNYWKSTSPTSSVLSIGTSIVGEGNDFVVYAFAPVAGYSSFGSYTGNGSADGPFVYTGFRPRWVMYKSATNVSSPWVLLDTQRSTYNVNATYLYANAADAELDNFTFIDHLSNGFKLRSTSAIWNVSGATYIYAAFAESPFAYARAR
jgi:hypothetical protein